MPGLLIRDLPDHLHIRLKDRATRSGRSLSREAVALLEELLGDRAGPRPLEEIDRLRVRGSSPLTDALLDRASREGRP